MVAMMKERCIALSCAEFNRKAAPSPLRQDNVRAKKKKMNIRKGRNRELPAMPSVTGLTFT